MSAPPSNQEDLFAEATTSFGHALARLATAYEANPDKRLDLSQEISFQLWRMLAHFDGHCSLRTWTYRVAHNVAASYILRERRSHSPFLSLDDLEIPAPETAQSQEPDLRQLESLIQQLRPLDRQIIVLYLEEIDAASIGEITGLSGPAVSMRIHRIKRILAKRFQQGASRND
ncbi:MAG: sigma-70 family RNA polymerase sigma factor [Acidobacteria bacterium]|nr:sigma-70 family RNA polymerase sigma factor [Acidobacteriota bacterium]